MESKIVKQFVLKAGADLCGIAGVDRFSEAPKGYHPLDVMPSCKSVISFACRFPVGTLVCKTPVMYTRVRNSVTAKLDQIALDLCIELERNGFLSAPVPTNEDELDECTGRYRSVVSQKHAAQAAGLGTVGRHSLLITPEFGSMVWLGAVLTEAELEPDVMKERICTDCGLCVEACPVNALETPEIKQQVCYAHAFGVEKENWRIKCHKCRDICPYNLGTVNSGLLCK